MVATMERGRTVFTAADAFPLGRRFGEEKPTPVEGGRVPFGVPLAVVSEPVEVDVSQVSYDRDRQIGVIRDGGVLVPLLQHTTGQTRTNTARNDAGPGDTDRTRARTDRRCPGTRSWC